MNSFDEVSSIELEYDGQSGNVSSNSLQILFDDHFQDERFSKMKTNPEQSTYFIDLDKLLNPVETTKSTRTMVSEVTHENRLPRRIIVLIFILLIIVMFLIPFCFTHSLRHQIE